MRGCVALARIVVEKGLNVRDTEALVKAGGISPSKPTRQRRALSIRMFWRPNGFLPIGSV
ncbi:MAG: hypothetical protein R3C97_15510 [Geminicoccaceae bacterium]